MAENDVTPAELADWKAKFEAETIPVVEGLDADAREQILARAKADGWSDSQADWLDKLAKQPFLQMVADGKPGVEALIEAYRIAGRQLMIGYYNNALEHDKNRYTAFLTVIDLEKQMAERRGAEAPHYPDDILLTACRAAEAAGVAGESSEVQVEAGFAVINSQLGKPQN
jgi:hypothetical protein